MHKGTCVACWSGNNFSKHDLFSTDPVSLFPPGLIVVPFRIFVEVRTFYSHRKVFLLIHQFDSQNKQMAAGKDFHSLHEC